MGQTTPLPRSLKPAPSRPQSGDIGTVACAAACDLAGSACAAFALDAYGVCTVYKSYAQNATYPDAKKYTLCFNDVRAWEALGRPDAGGMYW